MTSRATRDAWERFQSGAVATARAEILDSWRRSKSNGVDPERLELVHTEIDYESPFVRVGAPVLLGMADLLVGNSTSLALADADGTVTWRWDSDRTVGRELDRVDFGPGSRVGESLAGTNGIGITTKTNRLSLVVGAEHYKQPWHSWACVAAPVVHPVTRRVAGTVNVACRAEDANHLLLVVVRSLVDGVASALSAASTAREKRMLDAHLSFRATATGPVVTIDRQTMIIEDSAAEFGLDRAELWSVVAEAGPSATEVAVGDGLHARLYPVVPGRLDDGVVLVIRRGKSRGLAPSTAAPAVSLGPLEQAELKVITETLAECGGNKTEVAARLGISRGTLYHRLRRYRLA
ncbi:MULTISPECIES: helix-turn-helix domain-containing protein [Rhodococcus]|uniref:Regulatory protein, Fis family n=1 Tax=Rhodococcus jostii TaxID=132919 RepID=A0A1H4JCS2_RHOJO|nr:MULTISPECIES: helix-turn-helix domain-containing protein [Rhodococcus]KXX59587.1 hypothetical protein AZG88_40690 [Rhodococcus sp. LB1]SEB44169.1 regulatory protein, Fis family [Rhodococcus jostii]